VTGAAAISLVRPFTAVAARPVAVEQAAPKAAEVPDEKLFASAIGGNHDALGTLIGRYEKTLYGLLMRMTSGDSYRADDLFQETFLHAMRAAKTFDRKLQFKPWITAIAVNLVRDDARKRKVRGEVGIEGGDNPERSVLPEPASADEDPGNHAERRDEERLIQDAVDRLTDLEREVVLLHFYQSMTLVETATSLKVPVGTVKSRLHAALTRLSGLLEKRA